MWLAITLSMSPTEPCPGAVRGDHACQTSQTFGVKHPQVHYGSPSVSTPYISVNFDLRVQLKTSGWNCGLFGH